VGKATKQSSGEISRENAKACLLFENLMIDDAKLSL